ncbi:ABC transporter permease [Nocardioides sp. CFH 31398]|uniref:ABC transporter permease n=1 Tax=Nocardioides sp. CFH 31398 TaxID=2919579 RepID=UPI001F05A7E8|nr:ABC transporter permease [Nocardioides sp. CFH 31398]MCH1865831.1 ABC transporter permease [Nocardioides sp. CFH 31398]
MNTTYLALEVKRFVRDRVTLFFVAILPAFFYLIFGVAQDFGSQSAGNGNVALYIMVSMAAYGAVTATTGVGGAAAIERMQGWGRQLGLTPLRDTGYVAVKATLAVLVAAVPVSVIAVLGVLTGAEGTARAWLLSLLAVLAGAWVFALFGLVVGLAFRTEGAVNAIGGIVVVLGFLGNIFIPLSGTLLDVARFTPLYGYVALVRYPITEGVLPDNAGGTAATDPLWLPLVNLGAWALVLGLVATWLVRRGRGRQ